MTYYLLVNPNSGAGKGAEALAHLRPYLDENGISYRLFATTKVGQEAQLVRQILSEKTANDHLVIIGGDGTVSLVINELPADEPFSFIPAGSGNDFARSLAVNHDPITVFKGIIAGQAHDIFVMRYDSEHLKGYALNNIGIGLDAAIVTAANGSKLKTFLNKLKMGSLAYVLTALHVLVTKKPFPALISKEKNAVSADNAAVSTDKAFLMTFTKHPYFGGGVAIAPSASNQNGEIHLVEYDKRLLVKTFALVPRVLKGTHLEHPAFRHLVHPEFSVKVGLAQPVQIDGEIFQLNADEALSISTEKRTIIY